MPLQKNNIRIQGHIVAIATLVAACAALFTSPADAQQTPTYEYRVKAAFMFNFIKFIDGWKFQKEASEDNGNDANSNKPIVIGIIGEDPFKDAFEPLKDRLVKNRKVTIKYLKGFSVLKKQDQQITIHPDIEEIRKCDLIFICSSEEQYIDNILGPIRNESILTVADTQGFLEKGCIINFIIEKHKVYFEFNATSAKRANLTIRSKLLRLAKRVIEKDAGEEK